MKLIYRGSMPAPKFNHGDQVNLKGTLVTVQSRDWHHGSWHYSGFTAGAKTILYFTE